MKIKLLPCILFVCTSFFFVSSIKAQDYYDVLTGNHSDLKKMKEAIKSKGVDHYRFIRVLGDQNHITLMGIAYDKNGKVVTSESPILLTQNSTGGLQYDSKIQQYYKLTFPKLSDIDQDNDANYKYILLTPYLANDPTDPTVKNVHYHVQYLNNNNKPVDPKSRGPVSLDPTPPYSKKKK